MSAGQTGYEIANQADLDRKGRYESAHGISEDDVFDAMDSHEPYTTGELAEKLDIPRRTAYKYLETLAGEDKIVKKKPEPRRAIWMKRV